MMALRVDKTRVIANSLPSEGDRPMRNLPTEILGFQMNPISYDDGNDDLSNQSDDVDPDNGNSND